MPNEAEVPTVPDEVTAREAMEILGLTNASTVGRYVLERKLTPSRKLPGKTGAYLFLRSEIEQLRDQRAAARAEAAS